MKSSNGLGKGEGNQKKLNCPAKKRSHELLVAGEGDGGFVLHILYPSIPV